MCVCVFVLATNILKQGHFFGSEDFVAGPHNFNIKPMKVLIKTRYEGVCVLQSAVVMSHVVEL